MSAPFITDWEAYLLFVSVNTTGALEKLMSPPFMSMGNCLVSFTLFTIMDWKAHLPASCSTRCIGEVHKRSVHDYGLESSLTCFL